ncbi:MAG: Gfo/Idh/MocA family oxidoreductase [Clostridia bacterium]|nr:Gfo/Idh/MocA family oxidoreductase [Clostridia bacterium]
MKQFTVAIIGVGSRGGDTYATYQKKFPERMKIVAIAEPREDRRKLAQAEYDLPDNRCFATADELLSEPKLADVCIIATPDATHIEIAIPAMERGYDLLLEKPIAITKADVLAIQAKAHETGRTVAVCHVLRYTPFYTTLKKLLDDGAIGDVMTVQAIEQVGYWHQAHSFVRGNWRYHEGDSSMLLQKSCHDMDILSFLIGKRCLKVSSFGGLHEFRPEKAPAGAALRCLDGCAVKDSCPYDAEKIYVHNPGTGVEHGCVTWPTDVLTPVPTVESVMDAIRTGPYGRCVYHCDNNAVDHQTVNMEFEDNVTCVFTMTAFTEKTSREIKLMGTKGQIDADMGTELIRVMPFGGEPYEIDIKAMTDDLDGHGGGDHRMMSGLFDVIEGVATDMKTNIDLSVQSHLMVFAADESRRQGGKLMEI